MLVVNKQRSHAHAAHFDNRYEISHFFVASLLFGSLFICVQSSINDADDISLAISYFNIFNFGL